MTSIRNKLIEDRKLFRRDWTSLAPQRVDEMPLPICQRPAELDAERDSVFDRFDFALAPGWGRQSQADNIKPRQPGAPNQRISGTSSRGAMPWSALP